MGDAAPQLKPLNSKSDSNQKPLKPAKQPSLRPWRLDTLQLKVENFESITLKLPCQAHFLLGWCPMFCYVTLQISSSTLGSFLLTSSFSSRSVCICYKRFDAKTCILCHTYRLKVTDQLLKSSTLCVGLKRDTILILWSHV